MGTHYPALVVAVVRPETDEVVHTIEYSLTAGRIESGHEVPELEGLGDL